MAFHIFRREAVYYWRRRPPRALANLLDRPHLFLSLKTTSHVVARRLAAQLDLILEDAAMLADSADPHLSGSQIETMLRGVVDGHLTKLDRVAFAAKCAPGFDPERAKTDDKRAFWTYALLDAQGFTAVVRAEDRVRMSADGLSDADIEAVQDHLAMLRINDLVPTNHHILRRMIEAVAATPTAMNIEVAQGTYFRGMKLALAEIDRRYGGRRIEDEGFVDRMLLAKSDPPRQVLSPEAASHVRHSDPPKTENRPTQSVAMAEFSKFADDVILHNARDGHWDDKTQRQARSISNLFVKFMLQDQQVLGLDALRQHHVGKFVDFLRSDIYQNYGKSPKDEHRTIAELRAVALARDSNERGIAGDTLNRHLTFLAQIFRHAVARGVGTLAEIDLVALRSKGKKKRARDERAKLPFEQAAAIFRTPPFNNCAAWDRLDEPGPDGLHLFFHCALYFVPILIYYTGCRREELCGLTVDDVILDNGPIPYLHIAKNQRRRIKNPQSQRNIPLHAEVLRLNFIAYFKAIKALGYKLLFPDLHSPSSRSPLGDRFYKQFKPILVSVGVTEKGLGSHAVRHLFGAQLKKKLVAEEDRADLLGHGGDTETSERYCEPHEIATLLKFVEKLPVLTAHLQPQEVQLLPWVLKKEIAPFSQPSRAKRSATIVGVDG
jgi:integrase